MNAVVSAQTLTATSRDEAASAYVDVMTAVAGALDSITPGEWELPTDCTGWSVRDMAAHLLGAQEDALKISTVLRRRRHGRRRYPELAALDAANQVQISDHEAFDGARLASSYRANIPAVSHRVGSFPSMLAGVPVQKGMAPGGAPLRLGYLFNVIYLRDAWMHGVDLARATDRLRIPSPADGVVAGQVLRDADIQWGTTGAVEVALTGEIVGAWQLGSGAVRARLRGDGVQWFRSLSGRKAVSQLALVDGDASLARRANELRILF